MDTVKRPPVQKVITDDLEALLGILPPRIREQLAKQEDISDLLEVILDLGRVPEARFPRRETTLDPHEIDEQEINYVVSRISAFGDDNRAGITRTLHRISAIRNRKGKVVGLTLRVGRAVFGTIQIIQDLVQSGKSVLLLGRPGVGKTTMLREVARVLADDVKKRVIVVDTSNEIAGDGDIPHPGIGHARRMQVPTVTQQHAVMIEAVENHMPEAIIIDEIGTELEALAARTIAERGVQLVGTAHGNTLENLMMNPTLVDLIGGIQSVTLSDEEARRRGTQKSVLERKSPPTFDIVVDILDRDRVAIHPDVGEAVDAVLRGQPSPTEVRWLDENGEVRMEKARPGDLDVEKPAKAGRPVAASREKAPRVFLYGVNRGRLEQIAQESGITLEVVNDLRQATILVTSKQYYRHRPQRVRDAEAANIPIYVLKSSTPNQIRQLLHSMYPVEGNGGEDDFVRVALGEAEQAVEEVKGGQEAVDLSPQSSYIRRLQHLVAERSGLASQSFGKEPHRRVKIYR